MISWNINGIHTKLERESVRLLLSQHDSICLNEVKTGLLVEFPEYVTYCSAMVGSAERGGTVVCVRSSLVDLVHSIDVIIGDQVWLKFKNLQGVLMGFRYIPPCDSPYYSHASFAVIQEKLFSSNMTNVTRKQCYNRGYEL